MQLRIECSPRPWSFDRDIRGAHDEYQAEYRGESYEAASPPSAPEISPGDNARKTYQYWHVGECRQIIDRVEGWVQLFGQDDGTYCESNCTNKAHKDELTAIRLFGPHSRQCWL